MSIYKKLNEFKNKVGAVKKDGNNPFHKSNYSTIESVIDTIEEPLNLSGLGFYQSVKNNVLETIIYDEETSETVTSEIPLILSKQDMQQLGSAITYARRYGLVSMLGLEQEDDDSNNASGYNNQNNSQNSNNNYQHKPQSNEPKQYITKEQAKGLAEYAKEQSQDINNVLAFFKVAGLLKLTIKQYQFAMSKIKSGDFS